LKQRGWWYVRRPTGTIVVPSHGNQRGNAGQFLHDVGAADVTTMNDVLGTCQEDYSLWSQQAVSVRNDPDPKHQL
jgi:hypothetical protein